LTLTGIAGASPTVINNFDSAANNTNDYLFRAPSISGTTNANLNGSPSAVTPNVQHVTNTYPAGGGSGNVGETQFQFVDAATTRWLRHTTLTSAGSPNPSVDVTQHLIFDVYSNQPVRVTLLLRESTTANAPIGSNGGSTGTIEYVGATSFRGAQGGASAGPVGKLVPANAWTTLDFDIPNEPVAAFTGNGVLTPANTKYAVLESLGLTSEGNAGPYDIFYDNFRQDTVAAPEPSSAFGLLALGGLLIVRRRNRPVA
jgi:hypothetical protein